MKLSITEKFLWDLYAFVEGIDDVASFLFLRPLSMSKTTCPDYYKIKDIYEKKRRRKDFSKLISYLKRKGWIEVRGLEASRALLLTARGEERILKIKNKFIVSLSKIKKRRDGKLIMVAFDIPERKRGIRNYLREKLIELGFQKFQQSIWVSPYNVLKELKEIVQNLGIKKEVKIFLVEEKEL